MKIFMDITQDQTWFIYSATVAVIFLVPWVVLLLRLSKKASIEMAKLGHETAKAEFESISASEKTTQEVAYNAIGYAVEQRGKAQKAGEQIDLLENAVSYMTARVDIGEKEAVEMIECVLGKVPGEGASGKTRVSK